MGGNETEAEPVDSIKGLQDLLSSCITNDDVKESLRKLQDLMENDLSQHFQVMLTCDICTSDLQQVISDLMKVPDRMANIAAVNKVEFPSSLLPPPFCQAVFYNLGSSLVKLEETFNPEILTFILTKITSNFKSPCISSLKKFLRFLLAYVEENPGKSPLLHQTFLAMDTKTFETYFLTGLSCLQDPSIILKLFGLVLKDPPKFKVVENVVFLRGSLSEKELENLLIYTSLTDEDYVMRILRRAFLLVADKVFIEFTKYSDQVPICECICICLALLNPSQLKQAKTHFTPILMKGAMHWMDLTPEKRNLGMSLLLTTLAKFGEDKLPEWDLEDKQLLKSFQDLTNLSYRQPQKSLNTEGTKSILSKWFLAEDNQKSVQKDEKRDQIKPKVEEVKNAEVAKDAPSENAEEDLDSDDDDFPAYDMSNDTKVDPQKTKKILYLREVIQELVNPESDYIEDCFGLLPDLCRRHLKHEDPGLVPQLIKGILYSQNRFDTQDWVKLRETAAVAVLETRPVAAAKSLVPAFYDKNFPMDTRFGILTWLTNAAEGIQIQYRGKAEFFDYIKTCVRGLCGGAGWAKLEFTGLESHYVSQLLIALGSLLRIGKNVPGWPELASDYLDLVLFTARSGRAVIQTTCIHSISLVVSLASPHMVATMQEPLARATQWLAQLKGDQLGEEGGNALMLMAMLQQEYNKLVVQEQFTEKTTISFKTPTNASADIKRV
eukprot:TRINITY_DN5309_c0_g1_i3.p1 TRINITY_DN5309_c0_g1~~TRINITY_DN5309_c0_g1_i3.p1  ORF type:complete len:720 (+),score=121.01 TRINITY_DN5309_c0_g1_i3:76-2235(+)